MKTSKELSDYLKSESGKLVLVGFALFCCIVVTPIIGTFAPLSNAPFALINISEICIRFVLPFVLIAFCFRNISLKRGILTIVFAAGIFRIIAEFILSPVPVMLITTPDYWVQVIAFTAALCIVAAGASLFNVRKKLSVGIIIAGIIFYLLWVIFNIN